MQRYIGKWTILTTANLEVYEELYKRKTYSRTVEEKNCILPGSYEYEHQQLVPRKGITPPFINYQSSPLYNNFTKYPIF